MSKLNPETNRLRSFISRESIRKFERDYITLGRLADRQGVAAIHLAQKFDRAGVETINISTGFVRVYDREDVVGCGVVSDVSTYGADLKVVKKTSVASSSPLG